jgi:ABC-type transport system involved in cytochrome bd biosynthesis fused ATPase/permease subunit
VPIPMSKLFDVLRCIEYLNFFSRHEYHSPQIKIQPQIQTYNTHTSCALKMAFLPVQWVTHF